MRHRSLPAGPNACVVTTRMIRRGAALLGLLAAGCSGGDRSSPPDPGGEAAAAIGAFVDATAEVGLAFTLDRAVAGDYFMPDSMGTGCALLDYDGDGDLDAYLVNGFRDPSGDLATDAGANRLYRQEPDGRFTDVTEAAGVGHRGYGMGVATGDFDNDGDVDLYVTNFGPNCLYRNAGDGTFTDVTAAAGVAGPDDAWSTSAGFFDADGDDRLDLFVVNYLDYEPGRHGRDASGRAEYASPAAFPGVADRVYRNTDDGVFADASGPAGVGDAPGRGLGVIFTDLDGDGTTDVYVANDGEANFAWLNDGTGVFTNHAHAIGLAVNAYGQPEASMGLAAGDVDADGLVDLFTTHLVRESNTLYRQAARGRFEDATLVSALTAASIDDTGFGTTFLDVELDGDLDLAVANGRILRANPHRGVRLSAHWAPYAEPNRLLLNDGTGRFADAGAGGGAFTSDLEVGRGLAVGDVEDDGDLDLLVANGNGTLRLYRNAAPRAGGWLVVRVIDPALRRDAIGAVVTVHAAGRRWRREITSVDSYLSARDPRAHFGLGAAPQIDAIVVRWPDGDHERFAGIERNDVVVLHRGEGTPVAGDAGSGARP